MRIDLFPSRPTVLGETEVLQQINLLRILLDVVALQRSQAAEL
ncbi:hypothetical protein [Roseomonas harenae]|nr:hypothetical protein [Roseomonas harenae]